MDLQEAVSKDGLPRRAYAYAPDADPATWKLPYLTARGEPDPDRLPTSASALRGNKAAIPTDMLPMVRSKLRQAYRRWQGNDAKYPTSLSEAEMTDTKDGVLGQLELALEEIGRRNSASDLGSIQAAHDTMVKLGASCGTGMEESKPEEPEPLIESEETENMELTFTESGFDGNVIALAEADPVYDEATKSVVIRPIRAGWGNKRDKRYYTKQALKEAIESGAFTKRKMFADHPTKEEAKQRPERSVKDWVSSMQEAWWDEKTDEPRARIKVYDHKYWDLVKEAPEELAFSIRGGGYGRKGRVDGQEGVIVESIGKIDSVDWVTEAGAGGAIAFAESAVEEFEMDIKDLTAEQLKDENPELYEAIRAQESEAEKPEGEKAEAEEAEETEEVKAEEAEKPAEEETEEIKTEEADASLADEVADLKAKLAAADEREAKRAEEDTKATALKEAAEVVKTKVEATTLPTMAKTTVALRFDEAYVGEGGYESSEKLEEAVGRETTLMEELIKSMAPQAESHAADEDEKTPVSMVESRIGDKWGPEDLPPKDDRYVSSLDEESQTEDDRDVKVMESDAAQSVQDRLAQRIGV